MKKVLLLSLLATISLYASKLESTSVRDQTYTNDIVNSVNKLDFQNGETKSQVSGQFIISEDIMIINIPMSYKIIDSVTVDVNVPIVNVKNASTVGTANFDSTSFGDISLAANYKFGDYNATAGLHLATLRYKGTTGDVTRGLGTGKPAYTLGYNFAKNISTFRVNGYASYTLNDKSILGDAMSIMAGGSHQCFLYDKLRTNVKLSYLEIPKEGAIAGYTQANLWLEFTSKTLVDGMNLGAGLKVAIIDDVNTLGGTIDGKNRFMLYISTANLFPQTSE